AIILLVGIIIMAFTIYNQSLAINENMSRIQAIERDSTLKSGEISTLSKEKEDLIKQVAQTAVEYEAKLDVQKNELDTLKKQLEMSYTLPDYVISRLNDHGYKSPLELLETLKDQNALIPVQGVLGGTMRWWPDQSVVLNERFVFGYFEDGHILGYGLLEYTFDNNGSLVWKLIDTYLD
ncbi:MAG TPA: hypothetical protein DCS67_07185, partial [Clostridiales bacterium UBA8960]|nr:hypothetical protein [Clostridiales bacterium UBA8960]